MGETIQKHWISVNERLPQNCNWVITCCSDGFVIPDFYSQTEKEFHNAAWQGRTVTHWMPLPPPPKEVTP